MPVDQCKPPAGNPAGRIRCWSH